MNQSDATTTKRPYRHWMSSEDAYLIEKLSRGWTLPQIAKAMERSEGSVLSRSDYLKNYGLASLILLVMRTNQLYWDVGTLAALLASSDIKEAGGWRGELIAMSTRINEIHTRLCQLRDGELES